MKMSSDLIYENIVILVDTISDETIAHITYLLKNRLLKAIKCKALEKTNKTDVFLLTQQKPKPPKDLQGKTAGISSLL